MNLCKTDPTGRNTINGQEIEKAIIRKGYTADDFFKTLQQYEWLNVIYVSKDDQTVTLI